MSESQRCSGSRKGPTSKAPPAHNPSLAACHLGESKQNAHLCGDVHVEQVLGQRAAWKDQKSEFKAREPSQDVLGLLRPLGYFCPPLLLNRFTLYPQRVLIGQDLPSTTCDQFPSLHLGSAVGGVRRHCQMVCVLFREEPSAPSLLSVRYASVSLQVQPWLARNSRFIAPDWFPSQHSLMPLKFHGCISQWGRNQGDGRDSKVHIMRLKGAHDVTGLEWWDSQNYRLDICLKWALWCCIKTILNFSKGVYSLNKNNKPVQLKQKLFSKCSVFMEECDALKLPVWMWVV